MPIRVQGPDGIIIEFPDNTPPDTINQVMGQRQQEMGARQAAGNQQMGAAPPQRRNMPRSNNPEGNRPGANHLSAPNRRYLDTRAQRAQQRAPQGQPGTLLRAIEDFNRSGPTAVMDQMVRNIGIGDELSGWSAQLQAGGIPGTQRGEAEYNAARSYELDEQQRVAREQPGVNAASIAASIPAFAGRPTAAPQLNMLQGGAVAAGVNAPFAFGRQDGSFQERLPGAARESAVMFGAGSALTGLANRFLRPAVPGGASDRARQFEEAGVRPTMAAVTRPEGLAVSADPGAAAGVTKPIAENFIAGTRVRGHLRNSIQDTAQSSERLARGYGPRAGPEEAGAQVQAGLRRFSIGEGAAQRAPGSTRNYSFDRRASEIYDEVNRNIENAWRGAMQGGRVPPVATQQTARVLDDILGRNSPEVASMVSDDVLHQFRDLVGRGNAGSRTFQDLRDLRTYVRNLQRTDESVRPTLSDANLQRLEQALTVDMYSTLAALGGRQLRGANGQGGQTLLVRQLQNADRYYRLGSERIQQSLRPFMRGTTSPRRAYQMIVNAASEGGAQNTRMLLAARRSLQPQEWRQVAATTIDEMGRAPAGHPYAAEGAFSVEQFARRYNAMSPDGRRALFGDLGSVQGRNAGGDFIQLERALDNLARVAGMQKGVELAANTSRSAVSAQNIGSVVGLASPAGPQVATGLLAMGITGEMLTNPAFVRWFVSAARTGGGPGGMSQHLGGLARLASQDPALAPYYEALAARVEDRFRAPETQPAELAQQ